MQITTRQILATQTYKCAGEARPERARVTFDILIRQYASIEHRTDLFPFFARRFMVQCVIELQAGTVKIHFKEYPVDSGNINWFPQWFSCFQFIAADDIQVFSAAIVISENMKVMVVAGIVKTDQSRHLLVTDRLKLEAGCSDGVMFLRSNKSLYCIGSQKTP